MKNPRNISFTFTDRNLIVNFEGKTFFIQAGTLKYNQSKELIKQEDYNGLAEYLIPKQRIFKYTNETFSVDNEGNVYLVEDGQLVNKVIAKKLISFATEGLPFIPLVNFWNRLKKNPSKTSVDQLYGFLEANHHPITLDGQFIAYKGVRKTGEGKFVDVHTGMFDNSIGEIVEMPRDQVDADRNQTCSHGLHVAAYQYVQSSYGGSEKVEVLIDPADVVAVPTDYNQQKMRVCRYKVIGHVENGERQEQLLEVTDQGAKPVKPSISTKKASFDLDSIVEKAKGNDEIDLSLYSASQIIQIVEGLTGDQITLSIKNKQGIVKKATQLLEEDGFTVN